MAEFDAEIKGLTEFDAGLQRLSTVLPESAQRGSLLVAGIVVTAARPTVPVRSGRAAASLPEYQTGGGAVASGGEGLAYYRWLELGGAAGRNLAVIRPIKKDGRYINPAYEQKQPQIQELLEQSLKQACSDAGLAVEG